MPVETPFVDEATDVIAVVDSSSPVFVDASGRRGRRIRVVFGMLGAATLVYGALVATSLAGGPLKPQQLLPFPDLANNLPVLDPQPTPKPGAKNTPTANRPAGSGAKKINNGATSPSASASSVPVATTTPAAEASSAAPHPSTSASKPPETPQPSAQPSGSATPGPTKSPGNTEGTTGTALPGPSASATPSRLAGTVPVGDTSVTRPGASPIGINQSAPGETASVSAA
ncbi:hypothetical protein [Dactylosporangium sp. CA-139066]|uniref:hypothetical protein n=1 Tax=Dactylosporangium sp. CA-139066 TaxID=3239930 RepID=UPI003D92773D